MPLPNLFGPLPMTMPGGAPDPIGSQAAPGLLSPPVGAGMPPGMPAGMAPGGMPDPASVQYVAKTQSDGTVLLHVKMSNGDLGPAVKIISVGGKAKPV